MPGNKILLVEDDPDIRQMYHTLLSGARYDVTTAKDGEEAWDAITGGKTFELVLLDVVLPKKDGFEVLRDIRSHSTLHGMKVILLTNLAQEVDRKQGAKLGASDYVVKAHIEPKDLLTKLEECLSV